MRHRFQIIDKMGAIVAYCDHFADLDYAMEKHDAKFAYDTLRCRYILPNS
jgi:hypothetical protein